ncbi:MAG: VOC family protein [Flavobacteriales bacterium]|nr:VOC family protein [Flavobacteriales bacterium]MBP9080013.1 VOC family protein [Flavobacteriales bacterium]
MKTPTIPSGHHHVTPYFLVNDADAFIAFLKNVFSAKDRELHRDDSGLVRHAELTIGDAAVMLGQSTDQWKAGASMNYVYVADADATHRKALAAGSKELYAPRDEQYGVRGSGIEDPWGNTWWLAQPKG